MSVSWVVAKVALNELILVLCVFIYNLALKPCSAGNTGCEYLHLFVLHCLMGKWRCSRVMKVCCTVGTIQLFLLMMCFAHVKMWAIFPMKMFSISCQISSRSPKPQTKRKYSRGKKNLIYSKTALAFWFCSKSYFGTNKISHCPRLLHLPGFLDKTYMLLDFDRVPVFFTNKQKSITLLFWERVIEVKVKFPLQFQRDIPHILPVKYACVVVKVWPPCEVWWKAWLRFAFKKLVWPAVK